VEPKRNEGRNPNGRAHVCTVARVDIQHHKTGDDAGDDPEVGIEPMAKQLPDLRELCAGVLVDLPADQGPLAAGFDGDDRPAQAAIVERGLRQDAA